MTHDNGQIRKLSAGELDLVSGGASVKVGPINLYAGDSGFAISVDGVGSLFLGMGQACGSLGSKGGCI